MAIVTFESVAAAAEALQAAGQRASVRAVTAAIGGGSPNTVLKLLADWKSGRPVVRIADTELDSRITTAIVEQMQRVATTAAAAAEERAAGIDEDLQALSQAQAQAEQQITVLTIERDAAQTQAADFVEQLKEAQADAARKKEQATTNANALRSDLNAERQHQEATAAALARAEVRLEAVPGLQAEVERLRAALETSEHARQQAEQQAAVLAAKLEASDRRAAEAEARTTKAEAATAQIAAKAETVALELVNANATAKKSGEEAAELRGKLAIAGTQAEATKPATTKATKAAKAE
jgi:colicin import membrane protein